MFDVWPAARGLSPNRADAQSRRSSRRHSPSRSPRRAPGGTHGADDTRTWLTGNPRLDDYYEEHVVEREAREQCGRLPQVKRKRILLDCMNNKIETPELWIRACVRNHETRCLRKLLQAWVTTDPPCRADAAAEPVPRLRHRLQEVGDRVQRGRPVPKATPLLEGETATEEAQGVETPCRTTGESRRGHGKCFHCGQNAKVSCWHSCTRPCRRTRSRRSRH